MANQFITVQWVSDEILRLVVNKLQVADSFNTSFKKDFTREFAVGETVQVKFPQLWKVADGQGYQPQGIQRMSTTVAIDQWLQIAFEADDLEDALKMERSEAEIREQYIDPAASAMAQDIDSRAAKWAYQNSNNVLGALGTDPTGVATYYNANARMLSLACPMDKPRAMCISASMMSVFGQNITTIFNPQNEIASMFKEGYITRNAGMDWYVENSLYSHTAGTWASTVTVTGANQSGSSLIITGTNGDTLKAGDKFSIANVNLVNPRTYRIPGPATAKSFTVTQDYTLDGSADTINILPAIYGPGSQYQNVDNLPTDGAALTLWPGTTSPNGKVGTAALALSKYAFALTGARLYLPKAVESRSQSMDKDTGIGMRWIKFYDAVRTIQGNRLDSLLGFGNLYQDYGSVVVAGA